MPQMVRMCREMLILLGFWREMRADEAKRRRPETTSGV
jgi:hypothetical protein